MTHAGLVNAALVFVLVLMTLLLVMFIGAVIAAPAAPPASQAPEGEASMPSAPDMPEALAPLPRRQPLATAPATLAPLPRRRSPLSTANAVGTARWSDGDAATDVQVSVYNGVRRPTVSGSPPWGPAPKPPGPDPWAADYPAPVSQLWADEEPVSPPAGRRPASSTPLPGPPAPVGNQTRYPRHARER